MDTTDSTSQHDPGETFQGLGDYKQVVIDLSRDLSRLTVHAQTLGLEGSAAQSIAVREKLRNDRFRVAVVGEFNRGKSTLINALLGARALPADVLPCTATLNYVTYGLEKRASLQLKDGRSEEVPFESLAERITKLTEESEEQAGHVESALISYPSIYLMNDVEVIDTPGLNEDATMTQVTLSVLPEADAAMLVIHATSPFGEFEHKFLENHLLTNDIGRVLFVVNAIDQIEDPADVLRVVQSIEQRIQRNVLDRVRRHIESEEEWNAFRAKIGTLKAFGVSASRALRGKLTGDADLVESSGFPALERYLQWFLTEHRGTIRMQIPVARALRASKEILDAIRLREAALQLDAQAFAEQMAENDRSIERAKAKWREERAKLEEASDSVCKDAASLAKELVARLVSDTERAIDALEINAEDLAKENRAALNGRFHKLLESTRGDLMAEYQLRLQRIVEREVGRQAESLTVFEGVLNGLMTDIDRRMESAADVDNSRRGEAVLATLAVVTGFGGLWSGYKVAGAKGVVAGAGASAGTMFVGGMALAALSIPITWPAVIALGVASYFTGGWFSRAIFGRDEIEHFREKTRKAALHELKHSLGEHQISQSLANSARIAFDGFKNHVVATSEAALEDKVRQLQNLREERAAEQSAGAVAQRSLGEVEAEVREIAQRIALLAGKIFPRDEDAIEQAESAPA